MYKYLHQHDTIVPYEHQAVLDRYVEQGSRLIEFYIDSSKVHHYGIRSLGLVSIDQSGSGTVNIPSAFGCAYSCTFEVEDKSFYLPINLSRECDDEQLVVNHHGAAIDLTNSRSLSVGGNDVMHRLNTDLSVLSLAGHLHFLDDSSLVQTTKGGTFQELLRFAGKLIIMRLSREGITSYESIDALSRLEGITIVPDVLARAGINTHDNTNLLFTTLQDGLFLFSRPKQTCKVVNSCPCSSVEVKTANDLLFVCNNQQIRIYPSLTDDPQSWSAQRVHDIYTDLESKIHYIAAEPHSYKLTNGNFSKVLGGPVHHDYGMLAKSFNRINEKTWCISGKSLYFFENGKELPTYTSQDHFLRLKVETIAPFTDSTYLIGCPDGLYDFDLTNKTPLGGLHPTFTKRINDIIVYQDKYYIGTMGGGIVVWGGATSFEIIKEVKGLASNNVERIELRGNKLLVCTFSGLSVIEVDSTNNYEIRTYTTTGGLPSNQVFDADIAGDTLYVATGKGLVSLKDQVNNMDPIQPLIEKVNHQSSWSSLKDHSLRVPHDENDITIVYKTIDVPRKGEITYRYRLDNQHWTETTNTSLNLTNLRPATYRFVVQSSYDKRTWSNSTSYRLIVASAWWQTIWFKALATLVVLLLVGVVTVWRIRKIKKDNHLKAELRDLEKAALQAQMNPHFIFNCLNSIQAFILDNEKDNAMDYLAKFASLIRGSLHASMQAEIYLTEEIDIQENYLSLEQLGLDHRFEYRITVEQGIDQSGTQLPRMLVQPFLENAVIHGLRHCKTGGEIIVHFGVEDGTLVVMVKDNGAVGLQPQRANEHKSLVTSITKKRLAYINQVEEDRLQLTRIQTDSGIIVRLEVKARIKLLGTNVET